MRKRLASIHYRFVTAGSYAVGYFMNSTPYIALQIAIFIWKKEAKRTQKYQ
jgi:hypothetical protein